MKPWRRPPITPFLRRLGMDVRRLPSGGLLLTRPGAAGQWWALEKALSAYAAEQHVAAVLRMYRVNCVLDVGANRGQFARALRRAGYTGRIVSFEPVPEVFDRLRREAAGDPAWTAYPYALGREDGTITINVVPGTLSSVLPPTRLGARRYARLREPAPHEVPLRRLDGLLDTVLGDLPDPRPYLKLDTQGYDLEVFAGLGRRTGEIVAMQAELALMRIYEGMPGMADALAVYEGAGFEVTGLYPVSRQSRTARVLELDCVMVRPRAR
jgi:FkbM family methyltransferase